jgi:hypothetical protein
MKKLLYLSLILLSIQIAQAQTSSVPARAKAVTSKDDDTLVLTLTDTPEASWRRLAHVLVQRGYSIQHSDKDLLTISTYPLLKSGLGKVSAAGTVVNNTLLVRLYWGGTAELGGGQPVLTRRKNNRWGKLVAIGKEFGGSVSYTTAVPD